MSPSTISSLDVDSRIKQILSHLFPAEFDVSINTIPDPVINEILTTICTYKHDALNPFINMFPDECHSRMRAFAAVELEKPGDRYMVHEPDGSMHQVLINAV
jgi:hypothetical protein